MKKILLFAAAALLLLGGCQTQKIPVPTDAQLEYAYEKAAEAYSWFDMKTMDSDFQDQQVFEGNVYERVRNTEITSLDQLKEYLHDIFSDDIIDSLIARNIYRDFDGKLYTLNSARGADITKGEESLEIIRENDERIIFRIEVEILSPETGEVMSEEIYDFEYAYAGGKWLFTHFFLIR